MLQQSMDRTGQSCGSTNNLPVPNCLPVHTGLHVEGGATRPPPEAEEGRGASGSGRRGTKAHRRRGHSPGTATGNIKQRQRRCSP